MIAIRGAAWWGLAAPWARGFGGVAVDEVP
jgi:hypothetical protein